MSKHFRTGMQTIDFEANFFQTDGIRNRTWNRLEAVLKRGRKVQVDTTLLISMRQGRNDWARDLVNRFVSRGGKVYYSPQVGREFLGLLIWKTSQRPRTISQVRDTALQQERQCRIQLLRELNFQPLGTGIEQTPQFRLGISLLQAAGLNKGGDVFVGAAAYAERHPLLTADQRFLRPALRPLISIIYVPEFAPQSEMLSNTGVISEQEARSTPLNATLPFVPYDRGPYVSGHTRPTWGYSEFTVCKSLEAVYGSIEIQRRFKLPNGRLLSSTKPDGFFTRIFDSRIGSNFAVAVEVKDVLLSNWGYHYKKWAEQLAQRIFAITTGERRKWKLHNWFFMDLRGYGIQVYLMANAKRIKAEVIKAGRIGNIPGPFYDSLFFILEDKIVKMP